MEGRIVTPGPYRATKLWNEVTKYFRAGMPLRKHRQHFRTFGNCFTASEAIDWLHQLLKSNSNFGPEVTRQQTIQLLRKFLKNHVIEDLKGRWGAEDLEDNNNLYRFPSTSPVKTVPSRHPLWKRGSLENIFKERDGLFKMPHFSKRTPKKHNLLDAKADQENQGIEEMDEDKGKESCPKELSKEDIEDIWGSITLTHLQKILALPSLEEVLNPAQIKPGHIMYNMTHTSKHGVVVLLDKTDDLPHWVLSAMKCLANWPRNDMSQPTYPGFERDVFRTVADYFLNLPDPLLTFEYYELFVNILVVCGYITVPHRHKGKRKLQNDGCGPQPHKTLHLSDENFFKSTECLLLSLIRKVPNEEEEDDDDSFGELSRENKDYVLRKGCIKKTQLYNDRSRRSSASEMIGGSCQNLSASRIRDETLCKIRVRSCSVEGIINSINSELSDAENKISEPDPEVPMCSSPEEKCMNSSGKCKSMFSLYSDDPAQKRYSPTFSEKSDCDNLLNKPEHTQLSRSQSTGDYLGTCSSRNVPVAEITIKPSQCAPGRMQNHLTAGVGCDPQHLDITVTKRLCQSSVELSNCTLPHTSVLPATSQNRNGTQSLLQPHLERVAIEALQLCCLLLPPANRRKLQLLMRMISRMSQNVDMPRLHDAMGTRSLMIQTFSRCVLCCAEEVDLDELLATRLVSFLMDHHQEILQVPCFLQTAVQDHIHYLQRVHVKDVAAGDPAYYFCKQISTQEFEEQKVATSQAAIMELLESIVKDKTLAIKDKKKKLKQFQKEYPEIYRSRFPTTESEAKLFGDKPTIKQPMLVLRKPKFRGIRY
ncbi:DEP domain-containing protein 1A isoform X1 [Bombina bombina]|uniref:DEP domain-containing protein 1A isoform X1 n=1 Tax=Bombina bombina TaxID=8345 RepID=UPI00235B16E6|nr:DEP domain-containing protein 1A isoform X1 [Bombina bombina]